MSAFCSDSPKYEAVILFIAALNIISTLSNKSLWAMASLVCGLNIPDSVLIIGGSYPNR